MPDIKEYTDAAFSHAGTVYATEHNSLNFQTQWNKSARRASGKLTAEAYCIMSKQPQFSIQLSDPSAILPTGFTVTTAASVHYRQYEANGGLGTGYKSIVFGNAILVPRSLTVSEDEPATLAVDVMGVYSAGTCATFGTASESPGSISKCWVIDDIVIGGTTITDVVDINVNWNFDLFGRPVFEPESYHYKTENISGSFTLRDLAQATAARTLDGLSETVVINLIDRENALNTLQLNIGSCDIEASIGGGGNMTYNFNSLA